MPTIEVALDNEDAAKFDPATGAPLDDGDSLINRYLHGPAIDQVLADE